MGFSQEEVSGASSVGELFQDGFADAWNSEVRRRTLACQCKHELVPTELSLFWKGHSPRHFLPQASAAIGCDKQDRDFLGRWSIGRVGSNAYLHTSRQITERIQQQVLESLYGGDNSYDESELLDEVREFSEKCDLSGQRVRRRHKMLPLPRVEDLRRHGYEEDSGEDEPVQQVHHNFTADDTSPNEAEYFVTVSRRTGFRRLHVSGRCHVHAEKCQQTESVENLTSTSFDAICRICKRFLKDQVETGSDSSSSSDGSSSSTNVETSDGDET